MATTAPPIPQLTTATRTRLWPLAHLATIFALWLALFAASIATPPLQDDADATHAQAAQAMLSTGDYITLHVDGIRYLEKPPLPYWIAALSLHLFHAQGLDLGSRAALAIHLPLALTILALALLGYAWSRRAFSPRAALYAALFLLTSTGTFLFTRVFIPDALLSLLLALALYTFLRTIHTRPLTPGSISPKSPYFLLPTSYFLRAASTLRPFLPTLSPYLMWTTLALAVLTKGLVALVLFFGTALAFLLYTRQLHLLHRLKPKTGILLFLAIAAPWHVLAGIRNTHGPDGHGFFWFYFVNEHVLRFLGRRIPRDYNKLPAALYWSLHLIWLFPWSLFTPTALLVAYRAYRTHQSQRDLDPNTGETLSRLDLLRIRNLAPRTPSFTRSTVLLLAIFSTLVLVFFSLSTNQEYYTFPAYLPLLILLAAATSSPYFLLPTSYFLRTLTYALFTALGLSIATALSLGLYTSRHLPYVADIGALLAHRGVGDYTLSLSRFFDLTGPSFAALRLPAAIAAAAFALGPAVAWLLHHKRRPHAAILIVAATSAVFLIAARIALVRFTPMLSSMDFAQTIQSLQTSHAIAPDTQVLLYGDQAYGSSIPFYLHRDVDLVDGRTTSMQFGSAFPDAPPLFLTHDQLITLWSHGPRKILFVPLEHRDDFDHLHLPSILLSETSGKALYTDRPLNQ